MTNLNPDQFGSDAPIAYLCPKSKDGSDLYPQEQPDYDSMPYHSLRSAEELPAHLKQEKAFRYDEQKGFVPEKIHTWHLDSDRKGRTVIPAGYTLPRGFNPLQ